MIYTGHKFLLVFNVDMLGKQRSHAEFS